jgi:hypothetical protein
MALLVCFVLTVLTYYFIEKKIRHNKSRWVVPTLVGAFALTGFFGVLSWNHQIPFRAVPKEMRSITEAVNDKEMLEHWRWTSALGADVLLCNTGGDGPQTIILGDSNAQQYGPRFYDLVKENEKSRRGVQFVTSGGTPPIPGVENQYVKGCRELIPTFMKILSEDPRIDRVVISAWWHGYFYQDSQYTFNGVPLGNRESIKNSMLSLSRLIKEIREKNKKVILVTSIPTGRLLDPRHLHARGFTGLYPQKSTSYSKQQFLDTTRGIIQDLKEVGAQVGAEVVDPLDYLCTNGICIAEDDNGIPIRYDSFHLRPGYVREHVKFLDRAVAP